MVLLQVVLTDDSIDVGISLIPSTKLNWLVFSFSVGCEFDGRLYTQGEIEYHGGCEKRICTEAGWKVNSTLSVDDEGKINLLKVIVCRCLIVNVITDVNIKIIV